MDQITFKEMYLAEYIGKVKDYSREDLLQELIALQERVLESTPVEQLMK